MGVNKVIFYGETIIDMSQVTVTPATLGKGVTALDARGELISGTLESASFFAVISVTYPENAVCSCSDGSTTVQGVGTGGQCIFPVPRAGNWTIIATSGTDSTSQTVNITREGQLETVTLEISPYVYYYKRGTQNVAWSWDCSRGASNDGLTNIRYGAVTFGSDSMKMVVNHSYTGRVWVYTSAKVDITNIKKLYVKSSGGSGNDTYFSCVGISSSGNNFMSTVAHSTIAKKSGSATEVLTTLDVSAYNGTYTIFVDHLNVSGYFPDLYVYEVYGERK